MSDWAIVRRAPQRGMVTLRGDLSDLEAAVREVTGHGIPDRLTAAGDGTRGALWMSPDELMIVVPYGEGSDTARRLSEMLEGTHHLAVDVSDARALFRIEGEGAREVLAKLMPVDFGDFPVGRFRRTRMAQIAAAVWRDEQGFELMCFRSVARYAEELLRLSADPSGEIRLFEEA